MPPTSARRALRGHHYTERSILLVELQLIYTPCLVCCGTSPLAHEDILLVHSRAAPGPVCVHLHPCLRHHPEATGDLRTVTAFVYMPAAQAPSIRQHPFLVFLHYIVKPDICASTSRLGQISQSLRLCFSRIRLQCCQNIESHSSLIQ